MENEIKPPVQDAGFQAWLDEAKRLVVERFQMKPELVQRCINTLDMSETSDAYQGFLKGIPAKNAGMGIAFRFGYPASMWEKELPLISEEGAEEGAEIMPPKALPGDPMTVERLYHHVYWLDIQEMCDDNYALLLQGETVDEKISREIGQRFRDYRETIAELREEIERSMRESGAFEAAMNDPDFKTPSLTIDVG